MGPCSPCHPGQEAGQEVGVRASSEKCPAGRVWGVFVHEGISAASPGQGSCLGPPQDAGISGLLNRLVQSHPGVCPWAGERIKNTWSPHSGVGFTHYGQEGPCRRGSGKQPVAEASSLTAPR